MHRLPLGRATRVAACAALTSAAFATHASAAPTTSLLKQINPATGNGIGDYGARLTTTGGRTYFEASDGTHDAGPWLLTSSGATPIGDPADFDGLTNEEWTAVGDQTYFTRDSSLWVTDGTTAGTHAVADSPASVGNLMEAGGNLLFTAGDYSNAYQLTLPAGTIALAGLHNDHDQLYVEEFLKLPSGLVLASTYDFSASANPRGLVAGTGADSHTIDYAGAPVSIDLSSSDVTVVGDLAYFVASTPDGRRVFSTDGTDAGTHEVTGPLGAALTAPTDTQFIAAGNKAIFLAGGTIYETTGTSAAAIGQGPANDRWESPIYAGGTLFYGANSNDIDQMWAHPLSGPTAVPTAVFAGRVTQTVESAGVVYAAVTKPDDRRTILRTDGTTAGTTEVVDTTKVREISTISPRPGGGLLVDATSTDYGREIHFVTGTPGAAATAADVNTLPVGSQIDSDTTHFAEFGGKTLFFAGEPDATPQPWLTDGTTAGTRQLWAGHTFNRPGEAEGFGSRVAFVSSDRSGVELWATDGTAAGTHSIGNAAQNETGSNPSDLTGTADAIYYIAQAEPDTSATRLFTSNGTAPSTLVPLPPGALSAPTVTDVKAVGTKVYFDVYEYGSGSNRQLWVLDTATGEFTLLNHGSAYYDLANGVVAGGLFYVSRVQTDINETQIWATDGTVAGTSNLAVEPGTRPSGARPTSLMTDGTVVYATTTIGSVPVEGASVGGGRIAYAPSRLSRISGRSVERISDGTDVNASAFANTTTAAMGGALYAASGSRLVKVAPGASSPVIVKEFASPIDSPTAIHGALFFMGNDAEHGFEPWTSDGTTAGTKLLSDIDPGSPDSTPSPFFRAGNSVAFGASTAALGLQLYGFGEPPVIPTTPTTPDRATPTTPEPTTPAGPAPTTPAAGNTPPAPAATPPAPKVDSRVPITKVESGASPVKETPKAYAFEISGTVLAAKGLRTRAECRGQVEILITATTKKGKGKKAKTIVKVISRTKLKLVWEGGDCGYDKLIKIAKKDVPAGAKLEATVTFRGSATQRPKTADPIKLSID